MSFEWRADGGIDYLVYRPWYERGLRHGFTGSTLPFRRSEIVPEVTRFFDAVGIQRLQVLGQVHGDVLVEVGEGSTGTQAPVEVLAEADGFIIPRSLEHVHTFAIQTADCLPVMILSGASIALVHAGWRGLACGILERALDKLLVESDVQVLEVVIGPAAGGRRYEVGAEVIEALGAFAVCEPRSNKFLLALSATARRMLEARGVESKRIFDCGICTIEDARFHSYRRDPESKLRNLCFLRLGGKGG